MFNSIDQYRTLFSLSMLLLSMRFSTYCALCLFPIWFRFVLRTSISVLPFA